MEPSYFIGLFKWILGQGGVLCGCIWYFQYSNHKHIREHTYVYLSVHIGSASCSNAIRYSCKLRRILRCSGYVLRHSTVALQPLTNHDPAGDDCDTVASKFQITKAQFHEWNPAISSDCSSGFWADEAYCVGVFGTNSATSLPTSNPVSTGSVVPPAPTQSGIPKNCSKYYVAQGVFRLLSPLSFFSFTSLALPHPVNRFSEPELIIMCSG